MASVGAVGSSGAAYQALASAAKPEVSEAHRGGRDRANDRDGDDGARAVAPAKVSAGQLIGGLIDTKA